MDDRFKFRVWNKDQKVMKEVTQITLDKDQTGSMCEVKGKVTAHLIYQPHYILMQCTGLKDKNGTLIYEGDILKIKNEIFFIKYEVGSFLIIRNQQSIDAWYEMFTEAWNDDIYPLSQLYVDEYIQEEHIDCIEVIGNIYENKDLLNN